jgi:glycerol-3-phosphate acyltransferase PlsY
MILNIILAVVIGYLLGSVPFAYIAARLKGIDIRQAGGGNVGALNVMREIGPAAGLAVLFADLAKGSIAVLIAHWLDISLIWVFVAGFAAVAGHNWPVFLKFKGGKGGATTMGVFLALVPREFGISFAILLLVVVITSNARLGMLIGFAFLPLIVWQFGGSGMLIGYSLALPLFVAIISLTAIKRDAASGGGKKSLIFDREYNFWQTKRK